MAQSLKERLSQRGIPEGLRGAYAEFVAGKPDAEGITYLPDQLALDIVSGEQLHPAGYGGTGFALDPIEAYQAGFSPNQRAFISTEEAKRWSDETGVPPNIINEYLRGHELYHANSLYTGKPIGNRGQMASANTRIPIELTPAAIENWLGRNAQKGVYSPQEIPVERGAARAGAKRVSEMLKLRSIK